MTKDYRSRVSGGGRSVKDRPAKLRTSSSMAWLLLLWALGVTSMGTAVRAAAGGAWLAASKEALIPATETGSTTPCKEDLFESLGAIGATSSNEAERVASPAGL